MCDFQVADHLLQVSIYILTPNYCSKPFNLATMNQCQLIIFEYSNEGRKKEVAFFFFNKNVFYSL